MDICRAEGGEAEMQDPLLYVSSVGRRMMGKEWRRCCGGETRCERNAVLFNIYQLRSVSNAEQAHHAPCQAVSWFDGSDRPVSTLGRLYMHMGEYLRPSNFPSNNCQRGKWTRNPNFIQKECSKQLKVNKTPFATHFNWAIGRIAK